METLYYILGDHAARVTFDDAGVIQEAETYDPEKGEYVSDWKHALRIADHLDAEKVKPFEVMRHFESAKLWNKD